MLRRAGEKKRPFTGGETSQSEILGQKAKHYRLPELNSITPCKITETVLEP